jgi:hypothetical protein
VFWTGNEFNIIAQRCYITKEGYQRKTREIPGLTDLNTAFGVPVQHNGHTVVRCAARWKLRGSAMELTDSEGKPGRMIPIRVNQGLSVDAMLGKAERKTLKAVWENVYGSEHTPNDGEADEPLPAKPQVDDLVARLEERARQVTNHPPAPGAGVTVPGATSHAEPQHAEATAAEASVATASRPVVQDGPGAADSWDAAAVADLVSDYEGRLEQAAGNPVAILGVKADLESKRTFMPADAFGSLLQRCSQAIAACDRGRAPQKARAR